MRIRIATTYVSILFVSIFQSCDENNIDTTVIPDAGMYLSRQFKNDQIKITTAVYTSRPNYMNLQYTSDYTRDAEINEDMLHPNLDVYLPPNASASTPQPLLVMIHGGGFSAGDKDAWNNEAMTYSTAGYICASLNYRMTRNGGNQDSALRLYTVQGALEDIQNGIRYLKEHRADYFIDTTRIVVFGGSAGGALSLLNGVEYDVAGSVSDWPEYSSKAEASISTGATLINQDPANDPSLITYDAQDSPVLMFFAKEHDTGPGETTWTDNAVPTQNAINASGNSCTLIAQPDYTHTVNLSLGGDYWQNLKPFLWEQLRLSELE